MLSVRITFINQEGTMGRIPSPDSALIILCNIYYCHIGITTAQSLEKKIETKDGETFVHGNNV